MVYMEILLKTRTKGRGIATTGKMAATQMCHINSASQTVLTDLIAGG
jgi:hypothetical protein